MIVRFEDALLTVIHQQKHSRLFDRGVYLGNRFEHQPPFWRVPE